MSVGEALAQARIRAGLTIEEVSVRSLIRATVIGSIEDDDYEACGGPIYVNGYIRAIAAAIGVDPVPLIRAYAQTTGQKTAAAAGQDLAGQEPATRPDLRVDQDPPAGQQPAISLPAAAGNQTPDQEPAAPDGLAAADEPADRVPAEVPAAPAATGWLASPAEEPPVAAKADPADTVVDLVLPQLDDQPQAAHVELRAHAQSTAQEWPAPRAWPEPAEKAAPPKPRPAVTVTARTTRQQAPPGRTTVHPRPRDRERRRARWAAGLGVLVLVLAGFAGREIFASVHRAQPQKAAAANPLSTHRSAAPSPVPSSVSPTPSPSASPSATPSAAQPAAQSLTPARAMAFGPAGTSDGDNPTIANRAIAGMENGWLSNWYATSAFGALKQGTGLLVDMGAAVSITSVSIKLGSLPGATIEFAVGDAPVMSALHLVKQVAGAGGQVMVPLPAVKARYLLIWFTKLPPDGAGTYQANIDGIAVQGYR